MTKYLKCSGLVFTCVLATTVAAQQKGNPPGKTKAAATAAAVIAAQPTPEKPCNPAEYNFLKSRAQDWADLAHYRDENASLATPNTPNERVVFLGDSITDVWGRIPETPPFSPQNPT